MHTPRFVRKIQSSLRNAAIALGRDVYKHTEDRRVLEKEISPYFVSHPAYVNILFVGCAWYTKAYNTVFRDKNYQTVEIDPAESKYGAKRHTTGSLEDIAQHVEGGELDLIICNGVFGWGLNEKRNAEKAFGACYDCLREGGILILGWNDVPEHCPFPLEECQSLKSFQPFVFPPLSTAQFRTSTSNNHTYSFFVKP